MARTLRKGTRRFTGAPSRLQLHAQNNLGVIMKSQGSGAKVRNDTLELFDAYYENRQYDNLTDWNEAMKSEEFVPIRDRKPRVVFNVAKVLVDKVTSKLVGTSVFPKFTIEDDPEDTDFLRMVQKVTRFRKHLLEPIRRSLISGSCFVRFFFIDGTPKMEHYLGKYCYPKFDALGELDSLEVKYVYEDPDDKDSQGRPLFKWYRLVLSKSADILYDNPEYKEGNSEPKFTVVEQNDHNLGWVQGEWLRPAEFKFDPDGSSLFGDILDFIDDVNYSLSQSSQAVSYNQEPQLTVNGVDEDELAELINSSEKAWDLGREGEAKFVESTMKGTEEAREVRKEARQFMLEVVRVVISDPDKMAASAQSGRALEILNAPLVELIDELRTIYEPQIVNLLVKLSMTFVTLGIQGADLAIEMPPQYKPVSLDISVHWPAIFPPTIDDIAKKVSAVVQASQGHIISHETGTRWIAQDFGVEDIDEEVKKIQNEAENMPWMNPFGQFDFGGGGGGGGQ